jgi:undecaprenyl-diphosphatase
MEPFPYYWHQMQFMIDLTSHRSESLNPFFLFLSYFDSPLFFFVLIPALWIWVSRKWSLKIFYWSAASTAINSAVKLWFGWPRPSGEMPGIGMIQITSFGFPSGGAQTAMFFGLLLIYYWKNQWAVAIGSLYILLISFSRLYLGVHFPIDILGGWTIGIILASAFILLERPLEHFFYRDSKRILLFSLIGSAFMYPVEPQLAILVAFLGLFFARK